jgi:predicted HTH domain antitoxin
LVFPLVVRHNFRQVASEATSGVANVGRTQSNSIRIESVDVDAALHEYEQERISLGRLAELLDIDRDEAATLVEARGLALRIGPNTVEEARDEVRALRKIQSR